MAGLACSWQNMGKPFLTLLRKRCNKRCGRALAQTPWLPAKRNGRVAGGAQHVRLYPSQFMTKLRQAASAGTRPRSVWDGLPDRVRRILPPAAQALFRDLEAPVPHVPSFRVAATTRTELSLADWTPPSWRELCDGDAGI